MTPNDDSGITESTFVGPFIEIAKTRIHRNDEYVAVGHPWRGDFSPAELLVFAVIFETCGLTEAQAHMAALAATSALSQIEGWGS
jgi:hypothetical protein